MEFISSRQENTTNELLLNEEGEEDRGLQPIISVQTREIIIVFNYCIIGHAVAAFGIVANVINIITFLKMGFNETINISLLGLAISDLLSLITIQWLFICYNPLVQRVVLFDGVEIQYIFGGFPHIGFTRVTGIITVYITFERCLCVILPLKVKNILTPGTTTAVVVTVFPLMFSIVVPIFFVYDLGWKFYSSRNRTMYGIIPKENTLKVEEAVLSVNNGFAFLTFGLVIIFTAILIYKLKSKAKWREGAKATTAKDGKEEKGVSKERRAVMLVTSISSIFIICFTPVTLICIGIIAEPEFNHVGAFRNLSHAIMSFGFLLEAVNSSLNIFIYLKMSAKFRVTFYKMFGMTLKE